MENEVGAGCLLKQCVRREGKGRRSGRNGREMKRRKWREWRGSGRGRLDRGRQDVANVIVVEEHRRSLHADVFSVVPVRILFLVC